MKERPILFSGPMVKAILDGRKTQTRRVVKHKNDWYMEDGMSWPEFESYVYAEDGIKVPCPYGQPGDRLWVRETWRVGAWVHPDKTPESRSGGGGIAVDYLADGFNDRDWRECENDELFYRLVEQSIIDARNSGLSPGDDNTFRWECGQSPCRWRPSIHMPRWASRITLEITGIRVERLQEISEEDARVEGLSAITKDGKLIKYGITDRDGLPGNDDYGWHWSNFEVDARLAYRKLWESINGPGSWDANPWVWVVEFRKI